jgi:hypothetical protein
MARAPAMLSELLDVPEEDIEVEEEPGPDRGFDLLVSAVGQTFVVQVKGASSPGLIAPTIEHMAAAAKALRKRAIPVLAVPFMSPSGKQACAGAGVSWFDFSGNAHIVAPGLRIIVDGRPDRFPKVGRPASVFSPKSSRVVRWLLIHPEQAPTQREIAKITAVSEGLVSRIVSRLEEEHYVARSKSGSLRVTNPQLLLEAWRDEYRFSKHTIIRGHVAARSGDALTRFVGDRLSAAHVEHAATGLAAAWQLTRFAAFRVSTFFLNRALDEGLEKTLGFREDTRGANLWLALPNDLGVFQGAADRDGVRCVHPVQAYLDLKEHPERAPDAAERIRTELLSW